MSDSRTTELLRKLLDERGVEHYDGTESTLWLKDEHGYRASADELSSGRLSVHIWCDTPEQAIAATLGSDDNAFTREEVESAFVRGYSLGSLPVGSDPQWDESIQTVDEHMAELGWVRAAALGSGTCEFKPFADEDWSEPNAVRGVCSECSALMYGKDNYCPNCGKRIREKVDE